ncbi:MAG: hypothetical protein R3C61_20690 [Bacteroidia bacterium]
MNRLKFFFPLLAILIVTACTEKGIEKKAGAGIYSGSIYRSEKSLNPQNGYTEWDTTYTEDIEVIISEDTIWFAIGSVTHRYIRNEENKYENFYGSGNGRSFELKDKDSLIYGEGTYFGNGTSVYEQSNTSFRGKR